MPVSRKRRFRASLTDTDVTTATAIPIYLEGATSAYTVLSDDLVEIESVTVVAAAPDADLHVFAGADGTPAVGETVARGDFTNSGDLSGFQITFPSAWIGGAGHTLWVETAGATQTDVVITGRIRHAP